MLQEHDGIDNAHVSIAVKVAECKLSLRWRNASHRNQQVDEHVPPGHNAIAVLITAEAGDSQPVEAYPIDKEQVCVIGVACGEYKE